MNNWITFILIEYCTHFRKVSHTNPAILWDLMKHRPYMCDFKILSLWDSSNSGISNVGKFSNQSWDLSGIQFNLAKQTGLESGEHLYQIIKNGGMRILNNFFFSNRFSKTFSNMENLQIWMLPPIRYIEIKFLRKEKLYFNKQM